MIEMPRRCIIHAYLVVVAASAVTAGACSHGRASHSWAELTDGQFGATMAALSEPEATFTPSGGYVADNFVSNERSFQQVLPDLRPRVNDAYIGVGPEQNFTYIAALQPTIAFIVDVRRDNLLLHLMYKALFALSPDRATFTQRLFGRRLPHVVPRNASVNALFDGLAAAPRSDAYAAATAHEIVGYLSRQHRFLSSGSDLARVEQIYAAFSTAGPEIRWSPDRRRWIPTFRGLMTAADRSGAQSSFLATEDRFQTVKRLDDENRIVPVVGDFGGTHSFSAIADLLRMHRIGVGAFYVSNVEPYLTGDARTRFVTNTHQFPAAADAILIRCTFHGTGYEDGKTDYDTETTVAPLLTVTEF